MLTRAGLLIKVFEMIVISVIRSLPFVVWAVIIKTGLQNEKSRSLLSELGLYYFMLNGCYQDKFPLFSGLLH
jgi:hypothetical protein